MNKRTISAQREANKGHLEEGTALGTLVGRKPTPGESSHLAAGAPAEIFPVVVIGAGQAGLSVGYHLKRHGIPFVILDAGERIGDQWRQRWDSLTLFTPARYDALDGLRFPGKSFSFPGKDAMADFLESYAAKFALPVRTATRVDRLERDGEGYLVAAGDKRFKAKNVVVAMSDFQRPKVPAFARDLDPGVRQLHSFDYRNPAQLADGGTLIVGAGNSGADIAHELAQLGSTVWLSGRDTGHVPFRIDGLLGRLMVPLVLRVIYYRLLTTSTPMGRAARRKFSAQGTPLVRIKPKDLAALGVVRVGRTTGTRDGQPMLDDGRVLNVANVIWCTGFDPGFDWVKIPVIGKDGRPRHERGIVAESPGLYFTGLEFLYALSSEMVQGAGRDARHVVEHIASRIGRPTMAA